MNTTSVVPDVDLSKVAALGESLLTELDRLRESDPIHWSPATGAWLVTRHADIVRAFSGELPLSVNPSRRTTFSVIPPEDVQKHIPTLLAYLTKWIVSHDPPVHTRMRKLLVKAFSKKVVDSVRPYVQARVAQLLDEQKQNEDLEFVEGIARQLPGGVILKLMGLPQEYLPRLKGWANAFQMGLASSRPEIQWLDAAERAMIEMNEIFRHTIDEHRRSPREDLLTSLIEATEDGQSLSEDEMLASLSLILIAGHDTTHNSMTLGLVALGHSPQSWRYMYEHPDRTLSCVNEIMRLSAMSAAQPRVATEDFEWHDKTIRAGDPLYLMQAAGNRDPRVYAHPDRLDLERDNSQSLVFAPGVHHCVGHLLAKMQLTEFFGALVRRFEGVEFLDPALDFMPQIIFRGLYKLNVRLKPRPGALQA
jgi:pimeloyl-[acyl-carrier protein] synthase